MIANAFVSVLAVAASANAAALNKRGGHTCTFELSHLRTQNPVGGGDTTLSCFARLDYGDGRPVDELTTSCYDIVRSGCYNSQLKDRICVHTNSDLSDGYVDFGAQHRDFNENGCEKDRWGNPAGDKESVKCHFPC